MRPSRSLRFAAIALTAWVAAMDTASGRDAAREYRIAEQSLSQALREFALASNLDLLFSPDLVAGKKSASLDGKFTVDEGLRTLLRGSGLDFSVSGSRIVISEANAGPAQATSSSSGLQGTSSYTRLAQAEASSTQGPSRAVPSQATESPEERIGLEEIIVTAQKRSERLQDVPVPVTAISGDALAESNLVRLDDYYAKIPGLILTPTIQSAQILSIRGVTTGGGNPTVGIAIDDVPYGASASVGGGNRVPDIDPGELARVEVLRGPQGTLYGASSMGGLFKFVTRDPSLERFSGRIQAGFSAVDQGSGVGHSLRGSFNLPLGEQFAIRANGFSRRDPGYVENILTGEEEVNEADAVGGRIAALWQPSDAVSLKLNALFQRIESDGSSVIHVLPGLQDLQQSTVHESGGYEREVKASSATLSAQLGAVELISLSGYSVNSFSDSYDASFAFGGLAQTNFGVGGAPVFNDNEAKKFTQEFRLASQLTDKLEWQFGVFYTAEDSTFEQEVRAVAPGTGAVSGRLLALSFPSTYDEYAAFGNLTFHLTDRFDVQVGGRQSRIEQTYQLTQAGLLAGANVAEAEAEADSFTYLLTPRFKFSPDMMLYARLASGFRAGGINAGAAGTAVPPQFDPDETENYEIGFKGDFLNRRVSIDVSAYRIDWKGIQIRLIDPASRLSYTTNASEAKSQGLEFAIETRPATGLTIAAWAAWGDAALTEDFPTISQALGNSGDKLPYSADFTGNLSVDQEFHVRGNMTGFAGFSVSYTDERIGDFQRRAAPLRQALRHYTKIDARLGMNYKDWTASLYINNLSDQRGVLGGGLGQNPPFGFNYIQPRTIGLSVGKSF